MDLEMLRSVSLLRDLTEPELESFAKLLEVREAASGERLLEEGTIVNRLSIVCDGAVHVRRKTQTKEMLLVRMSAGGFYGEINLFDPGTATASIYAMKSPTRIAEVEYETLRNFMSSNPAVGYKIVSAMMGEMSRRLRQTSARLVNTVFWSSAEAAESLKKQEA